MNDRLRFRIYDPDTKKMYFRRLDDYGLYWSGHNIEPEGLAIIMLLLWRGL